MHKPAGFTKKKLNMSSQPEYNEVRYRKAVRSSILSIILFVLVYLLMMAISIGLFIGFGYMGIFIMSRSLSIPAILLGCFLIFMGFYFVIMLIRFLFQSSESDQSHLIEITPEEEPELFELVNETATSVGTPNVNAIYLTANVNAGVFHKFSFLSLFFPVKKHLQIGIGLLDAVTLSEFKAILAHEFGHFSQKSMRLGAYVGIVNRSIHGVFEASNSNAYTSNPNIIETGLYLAALISSPMALILEKTFLLVNRSYLTLSREMEFHADAIAAEAVGSSPLASGLLRLSLAQHAHELLINYYQNKVSSNIKTQNFFEQTKWMVTYLGEENRLGFKANLPQVTLAYYQRFNQSKLKIGQQWESHPRMEDRITAIEKLQFSHSTSNDAIASSILNDLSKWQEKGSKSIFRGVKYERIPTFFSKEEFTIDFQAQVEPMQIDPVFNHYYDVRTPAPFNLEDVIKNGPYKETSIKELFSNEATNLVLETKALEDDLMVIEKVAREQLEIKSYEYDGVKYRAFDSPTLYRKLKVDLDVKNDRLLERDKQIFLRFFQTAKSQGYESQLKSLYQDYFEQYQSREESFDLLKRIIEVCELFSRPMQYRAIYNKMKSLSSLEKEFKTTIKVILANEEMQPLVSPDMKEITGRYLSKNWQYFLLNEYDEYAIGVLNEMISLFPFLLNMITEVLSRKIFSFQASLINTLEQ